MDTNPQKVTFVSQYGNGCKEIKEFVVGQKYVLSRYYYKPNKMPCEVAEGEFEFVSCTKNGGLYFKGIDGKQYRIGCDDVLAKEEKQEEDETFAYYSELDVD